MLAYIEAGYGEPILLIHGLGSIKESWIPQLPLADRYRLIIPDLRGHGETKLSTDISLRSFAADLIQLLEELNIPSAYICGLSLGGIIAQELYRQKPSIVKGLILANTTAYINPFFAFGVVQSAYSSYRNDNFVDSIVERGLYNQTYREEAKKTFLIRDSYMPSVTAPIGLNYFPVLAKVRKPMLLIGSTHDNVTPLPNMECMKMVTPYADTKVLRNTGHLSNIESAEAFNDAVHSFIKYK